MDCNAEICAVGDAALVYDRFALKYWMANFESSIELLKRCGEVLVGYSARKEIVRKGSIYIVVTDHAAH